MDEISRNIEDSIERRNAFAQGLNNSKYDLDELLSGFMKISNDYFIKGNSSNETIKFPQVDLKTIIEKKPISIPLELNVYTDLITLINLMYPSLLAPFHHYNNYIDYFVVDFLSDDIKYKNEDHGLDSNILRRIKYQMEIQAFLISIKAGLDRFVGFFSYYYKGISPHTTFGRQKDEANQKYDGFMNTVASKKDSDDLLKFIFDEYFNWIKIAVTPRDTITHYNDLGLYYEFNSSIQGDIPHHFNERLIKDKGQKDTPVYAINHITLKMFTESWLKLITHIFSTLLKKDLITYKPKF